ncbi:unnamed protein product [Cylicocyclus nassatus]|uniref:Xylose isomerase-like TIM barrel domain-containing protein n=1 Tax=Cylicocyclus nassatus TaxID=53992 RepID=A0AA36HB28_CYLNA|nr:unnamed protein product [Cylicocyclus nassatus]
MRNRRAPKAQKVIASSVQVEKSEAEMLEIHVKEELVLPEEEDGYKCQTVDIQPEKSNKQVTVAKSKKTMTSVKVKKETCSEDPQARLDNGNHTKPIPKKRRRKHDQAENFGGTTVVQQDVSVQIKTELETKIECLEPAVSEENEAQRISRLTIGAKVTGFPLSQILPHGSYLMNPGSADPEKLEKTREAMLDECKRCERLGIYYYNFHPGSTTGLCTTEECCKTVAETIDYILECTEFITLVIETMAGQGNTIGSTFEEIRDIILNVKNKNRVGVCIDTCHIFAAGYDIRTQETYNETMEKFDSIIGLKYLKAFHLNDSKGALGCRVDRHEKIGRGKIGKKGFKCIMEDERLDGLPLILETPEGDYPQEMITLYSL